MKTIRKITHFLLAYTLCLSIVLLPVPLARADFGDSSGNFTIWTEAGRAGHFFEIWDSELSYYAPSYAGMGSLVHPGGTQITGMLGTNYPSMFVRDAMSGEVAHIPSDGSSEAQIIGAAWTSESGNPVHTLYFLVGYDRAGNSLVVSQNGAFYVATPSQRALSFAPASNGIAYEYSAPYDPAQPYRILDLTTLQQSEENANNASISIWSPISTPSPLIEVKVNLDEWETGHWFTIHSQYPGGPEMLTRVQAGLREYNNGSMMGAAMISTLTASIGIGMNITVERDADHFVGGGMLTNLPQNTSDTNLVLELSGASKFPLVPDRGHPLVSHPFIIVDDHFGTAGFQPSYHNFTLMFADGYQADISAQSQTSEGELWFHSPLYDDYGMALSINQTAIWNITLDVDPQQAWWLVNKTTGEQYPAGKSEILGAYENYHVIQPAAPIDWSRITFSLSTARNYSTLQFYLNYPSHNSSMFVVHQTGAGWVYTDGTPNAPQLPLGTWRDTFSYFNEDTYEPFDLSGISMGFPNPRPYEWPSSVEIRDISIGSEIHLSPDANNDLVASWHPAPSTPTQFSISSSRWGHNLVIRRANGHADGTDDYPLQAQSSQGDFSTGWAHSWFYFTATALTAYDPQWRVFDKSTGEFAPDYETNLITWYSTQPPIGESANVGTNESVHLAWHYTSGEVATVSIERKPSAGQADWKEIANYPVQSAIANQTYEWEDTSILKSGTYSYRLRTHFANSTSAPSNVLTANLTLADSDGDGMSNKFERLWHLNEHNANDASARINGAGLTASAMSAAALWPPVRDDENDDFEAPPDSNEWTTKPRATLWQAEEYRIITRATYENPAGEEHNEETYDILTWDAPDGLTGSVNIEREIEEGKWQVVATADVSDHYAKVPAFYRDWISWMDDENNPLTDEYVKKMLRRLVPTWDESFNHRLKGACVSNESQCKVRLRIKHTEVARKNPGMEELNLSFGPTDLNKERRFFRHCQFDNYSGEWWSDGYQKINTSSMMSNIDTDLAYETCVYNNLTWWGWAGYSYNESLKVIDNNLCSVWNRNSLPEDYYKYIYHRTGFTAQDHTITPSNNNQWSGGGAPLCAKEGDFTSLGRALQLTEFFDLVGSYTPEHYYYKQTDADDGYYSESTWTATLSNEYTKLSFLSDALAKLPDFPNDNRKDVWRGDDFWKNFPLQTGSAAKFNAAETRPGYSIGNFSPYGSAWWVDWLNLGREVVSQRTYEPYFGRITFSKSKYWLECNDCLPADTTIIHEWSEKRPAGLVGPTQQKLISTISINPGSKPGRKKISSRVVTSDVTSSLVNEKRTLGHMSARLEGIGRMVTGYLDPNVFGHLSNTDDLNITFHFSRADLADSGAGLSDGGINLSEKALRVPFLLSNAYIHTNEGNIDSLEEEANSSNLPREATQQPYLLWNDENGKIGFFCVAPEGYLNVRMEVSHGLSADKLEILNNNQPSEEVDAFISSAESAFHSRAVNVQTNPNQAIQIVGKGHSEGNFVARIAHSLWDWIREPVSAGIYYSRAAVIVPATVAKGGFDGFVAGATGDLEMAKDAVHFLTSPLAATASIKQTFGVLKQQIKEKGIWPFLKTVAEDFMQKSEKGANGEPMKTLNPGDQVGFDFTRAPRTAIYISSHWFGYGGEQVASFALLSATGGGVAKIGAKVGSALKGWETGVKLVNGVDKLAAYAKRTKLAAFGYVLFAIEDPEIREAFRLGLELLDPVRAGIVSAATALEAPLGVLGRVLEKIDNVNPGRIGIQKLINKLGTKIDGVGKGRALWEVWVDGKDVIALQRYKKRIAQNAEKLELHGEQSAEALEGFAQHYNRFETPDHPGHFNADGLLGRVEDYHYALKTDTPAGAKCTRLTQEAAINAPPYVDGRPKIMVKKLEDVYPVLYHHCSETNVPLRLRRIEDGPGKWKVVLTAFTDERGWYVTADKLDTTVSAASRLQLFSEADARYRVKFSTQQATDNLKIPYGDTNKKEWLEPVCHDIPTGSGGATQFLLERKEVVIDEIFDLTLNRPLNALEINLLIPTLTL